MRILFARVYSAFLSQKKDSQLVSETTSRYDLPMRHIAIAVLIAACGAPMDSKPGSLTAPKDASSFWCGTTGQCFTVQADCAVLGQCMEAKQAWCAITDDRWTCATDRNKCLAFRNEKRASREGECVQQSPGGG